MIESPVQVSSGLSAIALRPGDQLIFRLQGRHTKESIERITNLIKSAMPSVANTPFAVIDESIELFVIRHDSPRTLDAT